MDKEIDYYLRLAYGLIEDTLEENVPAMPRIQGKRFYCECGSGIFSHNQITDVYSCRCGISYQGYD